MDSYGVHLTNSDNAALQALDNVYNLGDAYLKVRSQGERVLQLLENSELIWRHRKHDPENGYYHLYRVIGITEAADRAEPAYLLDGADNGVPDDVGDMFTVLHSETLEEWEYCSNADGRGYLYHGKDKVWATEPFVIYHSTRYPEDRRIWARLLAEFVDGRFTLQRDEGGAWASRSVQSQEEFPE